MLRSEGELKAGAFLFDLDGTLVDTEEYWARAMVDWLASRSQSARFEDILPSIIGRNWIDIDRDLHRRFPAIGESPLEQDAAELRSFYKKYSAGPKIIKSAVAFFKKAAAAAPCAIVSGSPRGDVLAAAADCGLAGMVALVLGAGDYARGKPEPDGYLKAAELLGVEPSRCVVVEDSPVGVASAVAAGMPAIAVNRRGNPASDFPGARWIVGDLSEMEELP